MNRLKIKWWLAGRHGIPPSAAHVKPTQTIMTYVNSQATAVLRDMINVVEEVVVWISKLNWINPRPTNRERSIEIQAKRTAIGEDLKLIPLLRCALELAQLEAESWSCNGCGGYTNYSNLLINGLSTDSTPDVFQQDDFDSNRSPHKLSMYKNLLNMGVNFSNHKTIQPKTFLNPQREQWDNAALITVITLLNCPN